MKKIRIKRTVLRFMALEVTSAVFIVYILGIIVNVSLDIMEKYREKESLAKDLVTLEEKEEELALDVEKLKDPEYVGRYLREKFFYSKEGEYIIKIPEGK